MFADLLRDTRHRGRLPRGAAGAGAGHPGSAQVGARPGGHPIHRRRRRGRRGAQLPRHGRRDTLADHLIGGLTAQEALDLIKKGGVSDVGEGQIAGARWSCRRWSRTTSSCGRCPTATSRATHRRGSTAASWSTRCTGRRAGSRRSTSRRSTASIPTSRTPTSSSGTRASSEGESFGRASSEGGDIMPIGNRTVAIGMSERTTGQMIEKIALALFAEGCRRPGHRRRHDP